MLPGQAPATGITSGHLLLGVSMVRALQADGRGLCGVHVDVSNQIDIIKDRRGLTSEQDDTSRMAGCP